MKLKWHFSSMILLFVVWMSVALIPTFDHRPLWIDNIFKSGLIGIVLHASFVFVITERKKYPDDKVYTWIVISQFLAVITGCLYILLVTVFQGERTYSSPMINTLFWVNIALGITREIYKKWKKL